MFLNWALARCDAIVSCHWKYTYENLACGIIAVPYWRLTTGNWDIGVTRKYCDETLEKHYFELILWLSSPTEYAYLMHEYITELILECMTEYAMGHSIEDCHALRREIEKMIQDKSIMVQNMDSEESSSHADMQTSMHCQLWGAGKVGKTTLAKNLNNQLLKNVPSANLSFGVVVWVTVPKPPIDIRKIQAQISSRLDLQEMLTIWSIFNHFQRKLQKCGGFPLAITVIGTSMRGKTRVELWEDALKSLRMSEPHKKRCLEKSLHDNQPLKKIPQEFFWACPALRVLNQSLTSITKLPSSIISLCQLRALILQSCFELKELPPFANLYNLQMLDCDHTMLHFLPQGMDNLTNLRLLSMHGYDLKSINNGFSSNFLALKC
ncbi:hypothetical protein CQW23_18802 [Capsicum baccatum]|uniref:NB-ARC domain-containing protein n=1 Tax=Capsicum baccatum TaxID=33114 RepID=A0A2G2W400_CAPBA|nr:hypothetical protein CQW23_18802 [Capsicum baccatum]